MNIGVTGGSGVIGSIISQKLTEKNIPHNNYEGDIIDFPAVNFWINENSFTHIIHLASKVAVKEVDENYPLAYDVNVNGTIQLLKAIKNTDKKIFFFYASTSHVYKSKNDPIKETDETMPLNTYGLTKQISEMILTDYSRHNTNIDLCIGRIFSFYHHTQKPPYLFPNIKQRIETEDPSKPFKLYGAESVRDFLNAEVVCDKILQLCKKNALGIFNIGSGKGIKIMDFVKEMFDENMTIDYDKNEKSNSLVADITKLKNLINE